jgi:diguanylate cyclase (GGDEF)-like protein
MHITNKLSIKNKTYLLVILSVVVALVVSFVSNDGLNSIRARLDDLIVSTEIERYTNKLIHEEQEYRLNANGSVYNLLEAKKAYQNAIKYVNKINQLLNKIEALDSDNFLQKDLLKTRQLIEKYKTTYFTGVTLLTELNKQANILLKEGEYTSRQIQEYVESKRLEIKKNLSQKTIEKINNGSNIWQYTYITRLHEEKYRLSPDESVLNSFNKDYRFMMNEWKRLKNMSDQDFEFEKLNKFKLSAQRYENSMLLWVEHHKRLLSDVLPTLEQLGNTIISSSLQTAELSIKHMSDKRNNIAMTLLAVSLFMIISALLFGAIIARSITSAVSSFQNGLLNFFQYLNKERQIAQPIVINGNDEISAMAEVVNENIIKIQNVFNRKIDYHQALLEWSKVDYQDNQTTINKATELTSKALHVDRASIWLFNEDKTLLSCVDLYKRDLGIHESGAELAVDSYPEYFKVLHNGQALVVNNVREDSRTSEFNEDYLIPLDIYSMLDIPLNQDEQCIGVFCLEKTKQIKSWEFVEQDFAASIANAISLSLEVKKRHRIQKELKTQKERLHHHAHHDSLTNLPNRFLFNDRLKQALKQAQRHSIKMAVLFLDLDHFKSINDSMGHEVGDMLLIEMAKRLKNNLRQTDTLARIGGDEFTIILNEVFTIDSVVELTQNLLKAMNLPIELDDKTFFVTVSIGVAIYPNDGNTPEELVKHADAAMYHAKDDGRNTYQFYTPSMTEKAFERIILESSFRNALKKEEFIVYYQPQINALTETIIGMEALVRWMHPDKGLLSPANFLSFANESGLIIPMDHWVMRSTMTQFSKWYQAGLQPGTLSLNISIKQLQDDGFVTFFEKLIQETGCLAQWIELDVTEDLLMQESSVVINVLNQIKDLGISIAIDDFGTGYSSLSQLKHLPINKLKIDKSFILGIPDNNEDKVIIKTIIALAENLELSVISEGVATEEQKDFLLENNSRIMQGFYYSKPVEANDMEKLLKLPNLTYVCHN